LYALTRLKFQVTPGGHSQRDGFWSLGNRGLERPVQHVAPALVLRGGLRAVEQDQLLGSRWLDLHHVPRDIFD
jgi:hypothetical protein